MASRSPAKYPWDIPNATKDEAASLRALYNGQADENQQRVALAFIVKRLSCADDMEFRPDSLGGERASNFASGKRFVGQQIRRWVFASKEEIAALPEVL